MTSTKGPRPRKRRKRKAIDPQKLKELRQKRGIRALFARLGFNRFSVDGKTFTFDGRTGDIDDLFVFQNVVLACEYTTSKKTSEHVLKKKPFLELMLDAPDRWARDFAAVVPDFLKKLADDGYAPSDIRLRALYVSSEPISDEVMTLCGRLNFIDGTRRRYFDALSKTIHRSARHELFKFLAVDSSEIGEHVHDTSTTYQTFSGYLLPEAHSSFEKDFKVVSFYADPETLLTLSYVLRQDSWRDTEGLYQRILIPAKIRRMRRYLVDVQRVFVNNIIVTLPASTPLNDPNDPGKNLNPKMLQKVAPVSIQIPVTSNTIGIVDGQHRVFCYYEGADKYETLIASLRKRQNLLVTGLIFPPDWVEDKRRRFEAQMFLEINDTQARAKSGLKQSIELVLNPLSPTAIAKEITNRLTRNGPLRDLLQSSVFDPPGRIKTTSIVSYGLKPLVGLHGSHSIYTTWDDPLRDQLRSATTVEAGSARELLEKYISYCVEAINDFFSSVRQQVGSDKWQIIEDKKVKGAWLTPTTINGLFVCMRQMVAAKQIRTRAYYDRKLKGFGTFKVATYKSSQWNALGQRIFEEYFK